MVKKALSGNCQGESMLAAKYQKWPIFLHTTAVSWCSSVSTENASAIAFSERSRDAEFGRRALVIRIALMHRRLLHAVQAGVLGPMRTPATDIMPKVSESGPASGDWLLEAHNIRRTFDRNSYATLAPQAYLESAFPNAACRRLCKAARCST